MRHKKPLRVLVVEIGRQRRCTQCTCRKSQSHSHCCILSSLCAHTRSLVSIIVFVPEEFGRYAVQNHTSFGRILRATTKDVTKSYRNFSH